MTIWDIFLRFDNNAIIKYIINQNFECLRKLINTMEKILSKSEIINFIKGEKAFLKENFGVLHIGLFGSYARDQHTKDSDIDFLVEFSKPSFDYLAGLQIYMEKKLNKKIEIVRKRNLSNSRFFERIEQEAIYA